MADRITQEQRSRNMSAIRSQNTGPERRVRSIAHADGLRYRINRKDLPGTPDIVFPKWKAVVFVHGCYWHGHGCSRGGSGSKSNRDYWEPKLQRTKDRDARSLEALTALGWRVLVVWECELADDVKLRKRLIHFVRGINSEFVTPPPSATPR